jgi:hypothetical protein
MDFLRILQITAALATIATGLLALLRPTSICGFTGLIADGPRGVTEIRVVLGGIFIALGLSPLLLGSADAYRMLGIMYSAAAAVRAVSILVDRSATRSNLISLVVEVVFGVLLVA